MKNPMQPLVKDAHGSVRFKENAIVRAVVDAARYGRKLDLNDIAGMDFTQDDRVQFAQLIGYSLAGYHELSDIPDAAALAASKAAREQWDGVGGCRDTGCEIHSGVEEEKP